MKEKAPGAVRMNTVTTYAKMDSRKDLFYQHDISASYRAFFGKTLDVLHDAVDVLILGAGYSYPVDATTRFLRGKGAKLWWYYVAGPVYIPSPGAFTRGTMWKHWNYQIPGLLHWGMTYWGDINIRGDDGKKWPEVPWDTRESRGGDGYLVYPAQDGQTYWPSLRLEDLRAGAEDYEYLYMLDALTRNLDARTAGVSGAAMQLARNKQLLEVETWVVFPSADSAYGGDGLLALRSRIAEAIVATERLLAE